MEKTISYLNSRVWYRIPKVIFILTFIVVVFGYNFYVLDEVGIKNIDSNKSLILCTKRNLTNSAESFSLKDIGLDLNLNSFIDGEFDYKYFYTHTYDFDISKIIENCSSDNKGFLSSLLQGDRDIYEIQKMRELQTKYDYWSDGNGGIIDSNNKAIDIKDSKIVSALEEMDKYKEQVNYIYGVDKAKFLDFNAASFEIRPAITYFGFIKFFFLGNLIIIMIFEIIRRIFYYTILGTIKPKK